MLPVSAQGSSTVSVLSLALLGFSLGMRHATDADHVVAVTTILARERTLGGAARLGSLWGIGHTVTVVLVGGAIVVFEVVIPPRVGLVMELAVAAMLVILGAWSASAVVRRAPHHHADHAHHSGSWIERRLASLGGLSKVRPLLVGLVHGLAGSAAIALLVLGTIREPFWAIAYLAVFGVGTIAGMMLVTTALAMPFALTARRFDRMNRWLGLVSGVLSVAFGAFLVYRIGFVDGLFTSHPVWTPE